MIGRRELLLGAAGAGLWSGHAAAQPAAQAVADWAKVAAAAKREGKVVLYAATAGAPQRDVATAFERAYAIKVETVELRAAELAERVRSEQAAGRFLADVWQAGAAATSAQRALGSFQPHTGLPGADRLVPPFRPDDLTATVFLESWGILVNANLVRPVELIRGWRDLADPRWRGRILCEDMRVGGSAGAMLFAVLHERLGRELLDQLAAQRLQFAQDPRDGERRIGRGEFAVWIPQALSATVARSLPVRLVVPQEGCVYVAHEAAMLRRAPHPNAARLFMGFLLGERAQAIHGNAGHGVTVQGALDGVLDDHRPLAGAKILGTPDPRRQDEMLALAREMYK